MVDISLEKMIRFLKDEVFSNTIYSVVMEQEVFLLSDLDQRELDLFLFNSIGYFEFVPNIIDFTSVLNKLQILLKTNENIDKQFLADEFKLLVFNELSEKMQLFLDYQFLNYKKEKQSERFYDEGKKIELDQETGEYFWA